MKTNTSIKITMGTEKSKFVWGHANMIPKTIYRCVEAPLKHKDWIGSLVWIEKSYAYAIGIKPGANDIMDTLDFRSTFMFEQCPVGTKIEKISSRVIIENKQ